MNTEGTGLRQLRQQTLASMGCTSPCQVVSEWNPAWSPDGTKIAIMRFFDRSSGETLSTRPITVVDVGSGLSHEIGEPMYGSYGWGWSPDGKSILALPGLGGDQNSPGRFHIIDVATGTVRYVDWDAGFSAPSWQRVAFD
jgi:dipeptidyl aminopeptidase/acylaminoacyl peptidase